MLILFNNTDVCDTVTAEIKVLHCGKVVDKAQLNNLYKGLVMLVQVNQSLHVNNCRQAMINSSH